jgi:hypothetical protein
MTKRRLGLGLGLGLCLGLGALITACGDDKLSVAELQDPNTCLSCHPKHYEQWSGSMHAYASVDPVFRAMHARGQRETNGELGLFCVSCHAPMAVANGTITEANVATFDFDTLSPSENGITCYFCHNVEKVVSDHNNGLVLAHDQTMRGGVKNPVESSAHHNAYDTLMDSDYNESEMCGSCHDVTLPNGIALERSFAEWRETVFATHKNPAVHLTCGNCHMEPMTDVIADVAGVPLRNLGFHDHSMPGIDQALVPFPQMAEQAAAIDKILKPSVAIVGVKPRNSVRPYGGICLDPPGLLSVRIDAPGTGHSWPSGAAFDRRAWVEVIAYDANDQVVFSSGVVPEGSDPEDLGDPDLFGLWEHVYKENGDPAHYFWEIASTDMGEKLLKGPVTLDQNDPRFDHSRTGTWDVPNYTAIEKITARVLIRPLPYYVFHDLVASGDLQPGLEANMRTLEVATSTWLKSTKGTGPAAFTNCNPR